MLCVLLHRVHLQTGADRGLFQAAVPGKTNARWLKMNRTLQYYDIASGVSRSEHCAVCPKRRVCVGKRLFLFPYSVRVLIVSVFATESTRLQEEASSAQN